MKNIVFANAKGGVGKSALATQFSYYLNQHRQLRVLVIDLDHQRNSTKALKTGGIATVSSLTSGALLLRGAQDIESADFVLVGGDDHLLRLERKETEHNTYANNLASFLKRVGDRFDICVIDTNPNPDIRLVAALALSDFALAPIELNQEAIDGIGDLLNHERVGIRKIEQKINPKLKFLGILPNKVEPTPFQRDNFRALSLGYGKMLVPMEGGFAAIKKSTAIAEAQAAGVPVWKLGKTSGRDAWREMKPVFDSIAAQMEVAP